MIFTTALKDVLILNEKLILVMKSDRYSEAMYYFFRDCENCEPNITGLEITLVQTDVNSYEVRLLDLNHGDLDHTDLFTKKAVTFDDYNDHKNNMFFSFSSIRLHHMTVSKLKVPFPHNELKNVYFSYETIYEGQSIDDFMDVIENKSEPILIKAFTVINL